MEEYIFLAKIVLSILAGYVLGYLHSTLMWEYEYKNKKLPDR